MLDEILEYQQYSYLFDKDNPEEYVQRLKRSTLVNNKLSGLNRALTIIARHFLFDVYKGDDALKEKTIDALKSWLGLEAPDGSAAEEVRTLYKWLPRYAEEVLLADSICKLKKAIEEKNLTAKEREELDLIARQIVETKDNSERLVLAEDIIRTNEKLCLFSSSDRVDKSIYNLIVFLSKLRIKNKSFNDGGYKETGEENDINAINYDRILGNARRAGSLKRYYLACDRCLLNDVRKIAPTKILALTNNDSDAVIKMTAYCMLVLSKKGTIEVRSTKAVHITEADFTNWVIKDKAYGKALSKFLYQDGVILEQTDMYGHEKKDTEKSGSNTKKIRLNQKWITDSGFEILEYSPETDVVSDFLLKHPSGCVYVDNGTGKKLAEIKNK